MSQNSSWVFLPGTLCDERLWFQMWKQMHIQDRRYVPLQWANNLEEMDALTSYACDNGPVTLIGFSMGGYIAARYALANPDDVQHLILLGYDPAGLPDQEVAQRKQFIRHLQNGRFTPMADSRLAQFISASGANADFTRQMVRDMESDLGGSVLLAQTRATTEREDFCAQLAAAPFKTTLIGAEQDRIAPLQRLAQSAALCGANLIKVEDAEHMFPLQKPELVATLLEQA